MADNGGMDVNRKSRTITVQVKLTPEAAEVLQLIQAVTAIGMGEILERCIAMGVWGHWRRFVLGAVKDKEIEPGPEVVAVLTYGMSGTAKRKYLRKAERMGWH